MSQLAFDREKVVERVKELFKIVEAEALRLKKKKKKKPAVSYAPTLVEPTTFKGKKRKSVRKPGAVEGPCITLKEIAYDSGLSPKELRRILRKAGIARTGGRWEWPVGSESAKKIEQLVKQKKG